MSQTQQAEKIIRSHVLWSMGGGLIPIPLVDFAAVTAIQMEMLQQLSRLYGRDYSRQLAKTFVSALTGTTIARLGASFLKAIPGIGSALGGVSMSVMSGASTYAIGQVVAAHFASDGTLFDLDPARAREAYESAYESGKSYVSNLERDKNQANTAADIYQSLEQLGRLRDQGVLSEAEFQAKKTELLERL